MKLLAKFNLLLFLVFGVGLGLIALNARSFLLDDAKKTVFEWAQVHRVVGVVDRQVFSVQVAVADKPRKYNGFETQDWHLASTSAGIQQTAGRLLGANSQITWIFYSVGISH